MKNIRKLLVGAVCTAALGMISVNAVAATAKDKDDNCPSGKYNYFLVGYANSMLDNPKITKATVTINGAAVKSGPAPTGGYVPNDMSYYTQVCASPTSLTIGGSVSTDSSQFPTIQASNGNFVGYKQNGDVGGRQYYIIVSASPETFQFSYQNLNQCVGGPDATPGTLSYYFCRAN